MDPHVVATAIAVMALGAAAIYHLPHECRCKECGVHSRLRQAEQEKRRARGHRNWHMYWNVPWGDPMCGQCRSGYDSDRTLH